MKKMKNRSPNPLILLQFGSVSSLRSMQKNIIEKLAKEQVKVGIMGFDSTFQYKNEFGRDITMMKVNTARCMEKVITCQKE